LPYYTMPWVSGASLRERLNAGPVPYHEAHGILRDIAQALAYAHRQGIVHRDVKPENILLNDGTAMVADFGVARAIEAASTLAGGTMITQTGTQIGTPAYMAPEQAAGDPDVDFRADLYAFGVVAYELLAGKHPFAERRTAHALVVAHMTETPEALDTYIAVATPIAHVVMQCLDKDPQHRPGSASEVVAALDAAGATSMAIPAVVLTTPAPTATIAVLPFSNMSGDPDNEYFSDGITDDIISALTQVQDLRVAARASAFSYKGRHESLAAIGESLGVATVLQGSVRRAGNRVRVTAQLMNARDGFQLWSERFDRDLDDIFAIQDEIARNIVERLELTLGLRHQQTLAARPTDDLAAYELYLRGREAVLQRTPLLMRRGLDFFEQALHRDPNFARAHLGVAEAWIGLGVYQAVPPLEAVATAQGAIDRAIALETDLAGVYLARGQLKFYLTADWDDAQRDFEQALVRNPNDPLACAYMGGLHGMFDEPADRERWAERAIESDPLSPYIRGVVGMACYIGRDYSAAMQFYEEGLALDPNSVICLWQSSVTLGRLGRHEEQLARARRAVELSRRGILMLSFEYHALMKLGRTGEAKALVDEVTARSATEYIGEGFSLLVALLSGDPDAIEASLRGNAASGTGPVSLVTLVDQELAALLPDPRLGPLVRELTLFKNGKARVWMRPTA
ncbi:MAG: protein kinase domain-containing protein, partial [Gemmatimonadales bacterium]